MAKKKTATDKKTTKETKSNKETTDKKASKEQIEYSKLVEEMAAAKILLEEQEKKLKAIDSEEVQEEPKEQPALGGIDWDTVGKIQEELAITGGTYRQKDIPANSSLEFRLLQPTQGDMHRIPFAHSVTYWINKKPYLSLTTFGEDCPIADELKIARQNKDAEMMAMLSNRGIFNEQKDWYFIALMIESIYDENSGAWTSTRVIGDQSRIFQVGKGLVGDILKIARDKHYVAAGEGLSIFHRGLGRSITIEKIVTKDRTSYNALPHPRQESMVDTKYDKYYNETCDIMGYLEASRKSAIYLRAIIRNFLYSEPMPVEENGSSPQAEQKTGFPQSQTSILDNVGNLGDN